MSRIEDAAIAFVAIIESSGYCLDDSPASPEYDALHAAVNSADPVAQERERDGWKSAAELEARIAELEREAERADAAIAEVVMLRAGEELRVDAIKQNAALRARIAGLEARIAELESELDVAQEHIHAKDEYITGLRDELARVADLVRAAEAWRDGDRKHPQRFLVVSLLKAADALPPREGGAS